jgi:DHA2 family multidrug resistance protein
MLENLFHYTPMIAGNTMIAIGLSSAISMMLSSVIINKLNIKIILGASMMITAAGAFYFSALSLAASKQNFIIGNAIFGFGLGFFMVPLTTYSLATLPTQFITEAAGLFAYGRMLGTSIGVSLLSTLVARETQINWLGLGAHLNPFNNNLRIWLTQHHLTLQNPNAMKQLQITLNMHASMTAFIDAYWLIGALLLAFMPLILMIKTVELKDKMNVAH